MVSEQKFPEYYSGFHSTSLLFVTYILCAEFDTINHSLWYKVQSFVFLSLIVPAFTEIIKVQSPLWCVSLFCCSCQKFIWRMRLYLVGFIFQVFFFLLNSTDKFTLSSSSWLSPLVIFDWYVILYIHAQEMLLLPPSSLSSSCTISSPHGKLAVLWLVSIFNQTKLYPFHLFVFSSTLPPTPLSSYHFQSCLQHPRFKGTFFNPGCPMCAPLYVKVII